MFDESEEGMEAPRHEAVRYSIPGVDEQEINEDGSFATIAPVSLCKSRNRLQRADHTPDKDGICLFCDRRGLSPEVAS